MFGDSILSSKHASGSLDGDARGFNILFDFYTCGIFTCGLHIEVEAVLTGGVGFRKSFMKFFAICVLVSVLDKAITEVE